MGELLRRDITEDDQNTASNSAAKLLHRGLGVLRAHPLVCWLVPAGIFLIVLLIGVLDLPLYEWLIREDGPIEMATVLLAIATAATAAVVASILWKTGSPRWLALCWAIFAVGSFILAGEEASWGQRQIGFSGPDRLITHNLQDEANVHNLFDPWFVSAAYAAVGVYGAGVGHALWRRLPSVSRFADLLAPPFRSVAAPWFGIHALVYSWWVIVEPAIHAAGSDFFIDEPLRKLGEPSELLLGVGLLLFTIESLLAIWLHRRPASPTPPE